MAMKGSVILSVAKNLGRKLRVKGLELIANFAAVPLKKSEAALLALCTTLLALSFLKYNRNFTDIWVEYHNFLM